MKPKNTRADLHIYSRHSGRAADWVLRRLDFPASYSDPKELYSALRTVGMDFVTITDQNTIEGCLEIVHLPGVILGEEVSTRFPDDECRIHVLVWGITEAQHRTIQEARKNIFDLREYLFAENIAHSVAHPFHSVNGKLTALHLQKLILLFRHFEGLNGRYCQLLSQTAQQLLGGLTRRDIAHPGSAYTETSSSATAEDFLQNIREGRCSAGGKAGTPLAMAHSTYSTAFEFAKARLPLSPGDPTMSLLEKITSRFMEGKNPTEFSAMDKFGFLAQGIITGKIFDLAKGGNISLWKQLSDALNHPDLKSSMARETMGVSEAERRAFLMANLIASKLGYRFVTDFIQQISRGKFLESIQTIIPLAPIVALLSPYIHAFRLPRREWLRETTLTLSGEIPTPLKNTRRAWVTDTLEDVNGVATTIRKMTAAGVASGHDITIITCRSEVADHGVPLKNFEPIGEFELPEYELQRLSFPPVLQIFDYLEQGGFTEVIISTPGPTGLSALAAAKSLGIRVVGIYHTDFPQYVRILTDDSFMETLTWNFMHWFYSQLDVIYVNSEDYRKCWIDRGIPCEQLRILPRGLDSHLFHPSRRDSAFWRARGLADGELGMLFVGRISKEKNLDLIVTAVTRLRDSKVPVRPIFVGDGPYMAEMKKLLPHAIFTGYLDGEDLARAYASADFFVFPSTTDTFGNVILEAQASGLPVIVSDIGGPRDLVEHGTDGLITKGHDAGELTEAIRKLANDSTLRINMGKAARARVESRNWTEAFEHFWNASPE
ncbi:MAG: glycosyltransferase [Verrucomicrobia bacterium]|nr:glycosyltransferase [Verrucomicrobiota bacterium]